MPEEDLPRRLKVLRKYRELEEKTKEVSPPIEQPKPETKPIDILKESEIVSRPKWKPEERKPSFIEQLLGAIFGQPKPKSKEEEVKDLMKKLEETINQKEAESMSDELFKQMLKEQEIEASQKQGVENKKQELTSRHLRQFREEHNREPSKSELQEIAENVFNQLEKPSEKVDQRRPPVKPEPVKPVLVKKPIKKTEELNTNLEDISLNEKFEDIDTDLDKELDAEEEMDEDLEELEDLPEMPKTETDKTKKPVKKKEKI